MTCTCEEKTDTRTSVEPSNMDEAEPDSEHQENKKGDNPKRISIETVIKALQALPAMDENLLFDAIDFLQDENKARVFMALDLKFQKKWLIRKLRLQMTILLSTVDMGNVHLDVLATDTIADLKAKMQTKLRIRARQHRLLFGGRDLNDSLTIAECGIQGGSKLYSMLCLCGC